MERPSHDREDLQSQFNRGINMALRVMTILFWISAGLQAAAHSAQTMTDISTCQLLSLICFAGGFLSAVLALATWLDRRTLEKS